MKTRLDQMSIHQFIDMLCGDLSVLLDGDEETDDVRLEKASSELARTYRAIIDPAGTKAEVSKGGSVKRRRMKIMLFRLCSAMMEMGDDDSVRSILSEYGWRVSGLSRDAVLSKCKSEFVRLEAEEKREADKSVAAVEKDTDIRGSFARETAFLMRYYKMGINMNETTADVYAHLVAQAIEDGRKASRKMKR